jgi:hypothetical protein
VSGEGEPDVLGNSWTEPELAELLKERNAILLTDDHSPTDILVAPLISGR